MRIKRLLRTCMDCALEAAYLYEYVFGRKAAFTSTLGDSFDLEMMFVNSFDIAMTVVLDVIPFVQRSNDCRSGCYTIFPT